MVAQVGAAAEGVVDQRHEVSELAAGLSERAEDFRACVHRAEAVHEQTDFDAGAGFVDERGEDLLADGVVIIDEGGQVDALLGRFEHLLHLVEALPAGW